MVGSSSTRRFDGSASARASIRRPRSPPERRADRRARLFRRKQKILHVADDVPALAVDLDEIAGAAGERLGQRRLRVERRAGLVEGGHFDIGAEPHAA